MKKITWAGVMPAITTPFQPDLTLDLGFFRHHVQRFVAAGCTGVVIGGSLGEGATLTFEEKGKLIEAAIEASSDALPVILGISALSTKEALELARMAEQSGCSGLMVLPPYVYKGDWRETEYHFSKVIAGTSLPCMLYNNPIAYGTDTTSEQIAELSEKHTNLLAVKESSTDIRRIAAIKALIRDRLAIFVGVDDLIVEGIAMGAVGWVAGLVNAFPEESVALFNIATAQGSAATEKLYHWFLPLLRTDTVPKFVQLIKLAQQEVGLGSERVRPPRLELIGDEREMCLKLVRQALKHRP